MIFAVLYGRDTFIHVNAEMLKITFTFSMLSCDWRDDQIRMLQGNSVEPHGLSITSLLHFLYTLKKQNIFILH